MTEAFSHNFADFAESLLFFMQVKDRKYMHNKSENAGNIENFAYLSKLFSFTSNPNYLKRRKHFKKLFH